MASIYKTKAEALAEIQNLENLEANPLGSLQSLQQNKIPTATQFRVQDTDEQIDINSLLGTTSEVQEEPSPVETQPDLLDSNLTDQDEIINIDSLLGITPDSSITSQPPTQTGSQDIEQVEPDRKEGFIDSALSLGTAFREGVSLTASRAESGLDVMTDNKDSVLEETAFTRDLQKNSELVEKKLFLNEVYKNKDSDGFLDAIKDVANAIVEEPLGATQFAFEQAPTSLGSLGSGLALGKAGAIVGSAIPVVGTTIGGVTGFLLGMFGFNAFQEIGGKGQEKADDGDFTDEEREEALKEGTIKAGVITGVDALTLGASKYALGLKNTVVEKATIKALDKKGVNTTALMNDIKKVVDDSQKVVKRDNKADVRNGAITRIENVIGNYKLTTPSIRTAVRDAQKQAVNSLEYVTKKYGGYKMALALETLGEGLGEYLGELIATGEASEIDAVLESVAGLSQSIATTVVKTPLDPVVRKVTGQQASPDSEGGEVTTLFNRMANFADFNEQREQAITDALNRKEEEDTRERFELQYVQNILNTKNAVEILAGMHFDAGDKTTKGKQRQETIQDVAQQNNLLDSLNKIITSKQEGSDEIRDEATSLISDKRFKKAFYKILDSYGKRGETPFISRTVEAQEQDVAPRTIEDIVQEGVKKGYYSVQREINRIKKGQQYRLDTLNKDDNELQSLAEERGLSVEEFRNLLKNNYKNNKKRLSLYEQEFKKLKKPKTSNMKFNEIVDKEVIQARDSQMDDANAMIADAVAEDRAEEEASLPPVRQTKPVAKKPTAPVAEEPSQKYISKPLPPTPKFSLEKWENTTATPTSEEARQKYSDNPAREFFDAGLISQEAYREIMSRSPSSDLETKFTALIEYVLKNTPLPNKESDTELDRDIKTILRRNAEVLKAFITFPKKSDSQQVRDNIEGGKNAIKVLAKNFTDNDQNEITRRLIRKQLIAQRNIAQYFTDDDGDFSEVVDDRPDFFASRVIPKDDDDLRASRVPSRQIKVPRDARFKDLNPEVSERPSLVTTEPIQKEKAPVPKPIDVQQIDADLPTDITVDESGIKTTDRPFPQRVPLGKGEVINPTITRFADLEDLKEAGIKASLASVYGEEVSVARWRKTSKYSITTEDAEGEVTRKIIDTKDIKPITFQEKLKEARKIYNFPANVGLGSAKKGSPFQKKFREQLAEAEKRIYGRRLMDKLGLRSPDTLPQENLERLDRGIMAPDRPVNKLLNKFEDLVTDEERKNIPKQIKVPVDEDGIIDNIFFAERKIPDFTLSKNANIDDFTYRKDSLKKSVATKFIGRGVKGSSTDLYRQDYEKVGLANTGEYDLLDIVFVSTNGNRPNRLPFFKSEILKAIRANATFVLDSSVQVPDREEKSQYNIGELEVRRFLIENGYTEKISGSQGKVNLSVSYFVPRQDNRGQFVQLDPIGKTFAKIMDRYTSLGLPFTTVEKKYEKIKQFLTSFGYTPRKVDVFLGEKGEKLEKLYNSILPKDAKGEPATEFRDILTAKKFNINKAVEFILTKTPLTARIERKSKEQDYTERQIVGRTGRPVKPYKISRDGKVTLSELYKFKNRLHLREDANNILRALIGAVPAKDSVRKESNGYQLSYVLTNKNVYNLTDEQRATILKQIVTPRAVGIDLYIKESNMNKKRQGKKKDDDDGYLSRQILLNNITNHTYYSAKQNPIYKIIINNKIKKILLENRPVRVQNVQVKTPDGKVKYLNNRQTNDDFTLTVEEMQNALYEYGQNIFNFIQKKYIKANVEQQQDEIEKLIKFTDKQFKAFEKAFERLRTGYNERMYDGNLKDKKYENPFIKEVNSLRKKYTVTPEGLLIRKDFVNKNTKKLQEIFGTYDKRLEFFTPVIARIDKMIEQGIGDPSAEQDIKIYNRLIAELQEAVESYEDSDFTPSQYEEYRASVKETIKRYQDKVPYIPYIPFDDGQYVLSSEELNIDISTGRMKDEVPPEQFSDNLIRAISKLSEEVEKVRIRKLEGNTTKFVRNFVNLYNDMFETAEQAIKELSNTSVYDEYTNDVESFREYVNQQFKAIQLAYVEHLQRVKKVTRSSSPTLEEDSINLQEGSPLFKWENTAYEVDEDGEVFQKGSKAFVQLDQLIDQDQASAVLDQREDKTNIGDTRFAVLEKARELLDASKATLTDIKRVYNLKRIDVPVTNVMLLSYLPMQKKLSTHLKDQKVGFKAQDEYFNAVFSLEKMLTQAIDSTEYKWFGTNTLNLNSDLKDKTSLYSKIFENQQQVKDYLEWKKITRRLVTRKYRMQDIKSLQQSLKIKEEAKEDHVFFKDFLFTQFSLDRIRSLKKKGATRNVSLKELFMLEKYGNLTADQLEDAWHQDVEFVRKKYPNAKQILQDRKLNIISEEDYFEHKAWHKRRIKNIITAKNIERVQRTGSFSITELVKQGTIDSQDKLARVSQELKDYVQMLERHNFTYDVIYRKVTGKDGKLKNVEIPIKDLKKFPDVELTKIEQEEYIKGQKTDPLLKTTEIYKTTVQIAKRYGDNLVADLLKRVRNAEYTGDILTRTVIDDDLNVVEELDTYQVSKVAENESIEEISNTADQLPPEEEDAYYDSMINDDTGRTVPVNLDTYDEQDYGVEDFYPNDDNDYRASRVSGGFKSGVSSGANVKRWINQITRKWKFKPKVNIVNDVRYLPNPLRKRLLKKFGENVHLKGLYDNKSGTVYLFSDHLVDRDDVEFTFFHEVVGHLGMRGFLGQDFQNVLENLYKTNSVVRALADEKMETLNVGRLEGIEEALADLAGRGEQLSTVRRIIKFFTKGLRAIGMDSVADYIDKLTTDEIGYLLEKSFEFARNGGIKIFHGSPSAFRTHRNPIEIFARIPVKVDNKKTVQEINGYASYSHVTDTWTVFYNPDMTGLKQRDMPVQKTMANFNEAVEFLENVMGGKGKVEITHRSTTPFYEGGRQPNEFSNIYDRTRTEDGQRVSSFRKWIENVWQWTQNEYLPIFQAVKRAKNVNSAVDLRVFLQNNERRTADSLRRFKDEEVSEIFNLVETAGKKGATEDLLNLYLVATASEERNIQTLKNNNVPRDIIKEYIKIIRAGKLRDFFEIKEALKKKFPKQEKLINGLNLSGSGMSKYGHESYDGTFIRGYEDVIKSVESSAFAEEFKTIANILDFLGNEKIKLMLDAGLITLADAQKRRKAYKRYRAMAGMAENQDGDTDPFEAFKAMTGGALGKKFNIRSKDSRTATGRMGVAQNVLAQTLVSYQNAIIRAEKNRIAQKILHFLEDNYDPNFVQIAENQSIKIIDENGNESYSSEVNLIKDPSVFYARVKGVPVQMNFAFNEEGSFAQAINGFVYPPTKNILEYSVASVTKFTGRLLTTWNPFWVPVNFIRDIQTVYTNLDIDLGEDAGKEAMSDLFTAIRVSLYQRIKDWNPNPNYVKRFKFITQGKTPQYVKSFLMALLAKNAGLSYIGIGKEDKFKEMLDIYDEGRRAGGFTAFLNREGMDEQVAQIGRLISKMEDKGDGVKGFVLESTDQIRDFGKMMSGLLEFITIPMEVAPRLSAYKVARRRGLNPDKSANLSGEISVNFNMRGSVSLFRSFYLFFNPALQGTAKMAKMASQEPKRFMKASSFWIMLGLLSNFLARIFGGSDEEGDDLEKLPHYQRSTKFIIAPNMELGALPIAYGWNAFYSLGHFMLDPIIGNVTWGQTGKNILASSFEAFSPVAQGVGDAKTFQSGLIKAVAPTVSQPSFEYWFNENRFGTPIYKDRSFGQPSTSATQMAFRNVSPMAERFAVRLQELTGGNIFNQKGIDFNPAFIDHVFRNHLGGVPNEIYQSMARSQREKLGLDLTEDQTYWARKFGAFVPERRHVGLYLELKNKVLTLANEAEKLPIEAESLDTLFNTPIRKETILDEYPDVFAMRELINEVDNQLKDLNKQYNELNEYNKFVRLQEGQEDAMTKEAVIEMLNQINRSKEDLYGMTISILYENGYREGRKKPN